MEITEGLFDRMVLQRTRANVSDAAFSGTCPGPGVVRASVSASGRAFKGLHGVAVGSARNGRLSGRIAGIPAGGPCDITLSCDCGERTVVRDVLVGDVWVLAGQSNMAGYGRIEGREPSHPRVRAFFMDDRWAIAKDPIHNTWDAADPVYAFITSGGIPGARILPRKGQVVGPGVSFGKALLEATGVPQGLIPCGQGSSSIGQWDPALKVRGGASLYGAMLRRFRANGGRVAGVFWFQGEQNSLDDTAFTYGLKTARLFAEMRRDFGDPRLPIVLAQIAAVYREPGAAPHWDVIREAQRRLPERVAHLAVVPTIDLPVMADAVHLDGPSQRRLGRRAARAMLVLRYGRVFGRPPIALGGITVRKNAASGTADILVRFRNVSGRLVASGPANGFTLIREGIPAPRIFRVDLPVRGGIVTCRTTCSVAEARGLSFSYGFGPAPVCTITDEADRSLPAFGPLPLARPGGG